MIIDLRYYINPAGTKFVPGSLYKLNDSPYGRKDGVYYRFTRRDQNGEAVIATTGNEEDTFGVYHPETMCVDGGDAVMLVAFHDSEEIYKKSEEPLGLFLYKEKFFLSDFTSSFTEF
jgi:hypothetical protein